MAPNIIYSYSDWLKCDKNSFLTFSSPAKLCKSSPFPIPRCGFCCLTIRLHDRQHFPRILNECENSLSVTASPFSTLRCGFSTMERRPWGCLLPLCSCSAHFLFLGIVSVDSKMKNADLTHQTAHAVCGEQMKSPFKQKELKNSKSFF